MTTPWPKHTRTHNQRTPAHTNAKKICALVMTAILGCATVTDRYQRPAHTRGNISSGATPLRPLCDCAPLPGRESWAPLNGKHCVRRLKPRSREAGLEDSKTRNTIKAKIFVYYDANLVRLENVTTGFVAPAAVSPMM